MSEHPGFCPACFAPLAQEADACPACGARMADLSSRDYREKLVHSLYMAAERATDKLAGELPHLAEAMIAAASAAIVALWQQRNTTPDRAAEAGAATVQKMIAAHVGKILRMLEELHRQLEDVLRQGRQCLAAVDDGDESLPLPADAPLSDAAAILRRPCCRFCP